MEINISYIMNTSWHHHMSGHWISVSSEVTSWTETDGRSFFISPRDSHYMRLWWTKLLAKWSLLRASETPGHQVMFLSVPEMFCSDQNCDVSCEHQVHGAKCDEIPPRVIISCERSFIIIWQLRYYIRVARGRWEFQNWDWFRSSVVTSLPYQVRKQTKSEIH